MRVVPAQTGFTRQVSEAVLTCICRLQGVVLAHLTVLQELRISTGAMVETIRLHLAGLPPSLRRLRVTHGHKESVFPKLIIVAARACDLAAAAYDPFTAHDETIRTCHAASLQPAAPPGPKLLSLGVDCSMIVLPAAWPLAAFWAVTLHSAVLTVTLTGEQPAWVGSDRERVRCPFRMPPLQLFLGCHLSVLLHATRLAMTRVPVTQIRRHSMHCICRNPPNRTSEEQMPQVTAGLAAWVARTKAASVKIHVRPNGDYREDFGPRIALASSLLTVDGRYSDQVATKWADLGELAYALVAPCLRWGLRCCLEQGADGDAIVMRRML